MGLVKNHYIGCTFTTLDQRSREQAVHIKLGALRSCVEGRRVAMINDSTVRSTTSRQIVILLRKAGAMRVHLRTSTSPFITPYYLGADIPNSEHLIVHNRSPEGICALTDANSLGFPPPKIPYQVTPDAGCGLCDGCFTGNYPIRL